MKEEFKGSVRNLIWKRYISLIRTTGIIHGRVLNLERKFIKSEGSKVKTIFCLNSGNRRNIKPNSRFLKSETFKFDEFIFARWESL